MYILILIFRFKFCHLFQLSKLYFVCHKYHSRQNKCYLIFKIHSILAVANLLAHNNNSQICYCVQISFQSAAFNCAFSDNLKPLGVAFILLAMVSISHILSQTKKKLPRKIQFVLHTRNKICI